MVKIDRKVKMSIIDLHKTGYSTNRIIKTLQTRGITVTRRIVCYWIKAFLSGKLDVEGCNTKENSGYFNAVSVDDARFIKKNLMLNPMSLVPLCIT